MRTVLAAGAVLLLAGCQTQQISEMNYTQRKELAGKLVQRCIDQGVKLGSAEMQTCTWAEAQAENAKRQNARRQMAAMGAAMQNAGNQMQANARNQQLINAMNRPVNCTSTSGGYGMVRTTCY